MMDVIEKKEKEALDLLMKIDEMKKQNWILDNEIYRLNQSYKLLRSTKALAVSLAEFKKIRESIVKAQKIHKERQKNILGAEESYKKMKWGIEKERDTYLTSMRVLEVDFGKQTKK